MSERQWQAARVVEQACQLLSAGQPDEAKALLRHGYALDPTPRAPCAYEGPRVSEPKLETKPVRRGPSKKQLAALHARDGYVDRYTGGPLIAPAVLRLLGDIENGPFGDVLPYDVNGGRGQPANGGRRATCHQAGFELYATFEHVRPVSVGGTNDLENLVSSSVDVNYEKGDETWSPGPITGLMSEWDGLSRWFLDFTASGNCYWFRDLNPWRAAFLEAETSD